MVAAGKPGFQDLDPDQQGVYEAESMCSLCLFLCPQSRSLFPHFYTGHIPVLGQPPGFACRGISLPPTVTHFCLVPGGGDVKIESQKLNFKEKAQAKVGSLDNVGHLPAGGAVKVVSGSWRGHSWGVGLCDWSLGPSRWAPVTAPQSLQGSCFTHTIAVSIVCHQS